MAIVNHAKKEINAKIVCYGPAASGKSTALNYIFSRIKSSLRGDLKRVPAGADNLLFFDFSPFDAPLANGYRVRLHVYTLCGVVTNPATWKMTLKGADGIMIMIDSAAREIAPARESVAQLREFLSVYGVGLSDTPAVLLLNSQNNDPVTDDTAAVAAALDLSAMEFCRTSTATGEGLLDALAKLSRRLLDRVTIQETPTETETPPLTPISEFETAKPDRQPLPEVPAAPSQIPSDPQAVLLSQDAGSSNTNLRIPLEIMLGGTLRRLVVNVSVELEDESMEPHTPSLLLPEAFLATPV